MPLPDSAGNILVSGIETDFLGFISQGADVFEKNRIYDMHIEGLRQADKKTLFWKRFCEGPDETWKLIEDNLDRILTLFNIEEIEDKYLKYAIKLVGWTHDLKTITDKLDDNALRRLLESSIALWKRRGVSGGYTEILNLVIGVDAWEWDWFDKRFIIGEARLGYDQQGSDAYFLGEVGRRESNLRIVDPLRKLDHELIAEIVKLWKPSGERVLITYINFFDRFDDDSKGWATEGVGVPSPVDSDISGGTLNLANPSDAETAYPTSTDQEDLKDYSVTARIKFDNFVAGGTKDAHIAVVARNVAFPDGLFAEFRMEDPEFNEVHFTLNHITIASADITRDHGFILQPDTFYTLRLEIFKLSDTEAFATAYIDNVKVLESAVPSDGVSPFQVARAGKPSVACGYQVTAQCDMFEVVPLPGKNTYVGINGEIADT